MFQHNSQRQPVTGLDTREEWLLSHACKSFKLASLGSNGKLQANKLGIQWYPRVQFLIKNAHRTRRNLEPTTALFLQRFDASYGGAGKRHWSDLDVCISCWSAVVLQYCDDVISAVTEFMDARDVCY